MSEPPQSTFGSLHQESLYDRIKDKPLHVDVIILQKGRTRPHIIEEELKRVQDAHTLDELKEKLLEAQQRLEALNIFEAVQLVLDQSLHVSTQKGVASVLESSRYSSNVDRYDQSACRQTLSHVLCKLIAQKGEYGMRMLAHTWQRLKVLAHRLTWHMLPFTQADQCVELTSAPMLQQNSRVSLVSQTLLGTLRKLILPWSAAPRTAPNMLSNSQGHKCGVQAWIAERVWHSTSLIASSGPHMLKITAAAF